MKKKQTKTIVKYSVTYTPAFTTEVFELLSKCDLGITGGEHPVTDLYSWTTTSKVDRTYLIKTRRAIRNGLKANGITQIHSIKKIK